MQDSQRGNPIGKVLVQLLSNRHKWHQYDKPCVLNPHTTTVKKLHNLHYMTLTLPKGGVMSTKSPAKYLEQPTS